MFYFRLITQELNKNVIPEVLYRNSKLLHMETEKSLRVNSAIIPQLCFILYLHK